MLLYIISTSVSLKASVNNFTELQNSREISLHKLRHQIYFLGQMKRFFEAWSKAQALQLHIV